MTTAHWFSSKLRNLDRDECLRLLATQQVGRIAFTDDSGTDIMPVNFVLDGEDVLIATTGYGAIARGSTNARVAFEVDDYDTYNESGWSVVVRGRAHRESPLQSSAERPEPWADGSRTFLLRISGEAISGRRLIPS